MTLILVSLVLPAPWGKDQVPSMKLGFNYPEQVRASKCVALCEADDVYPSAYSADIHCQLLGNFEGTPLFQFSIK